MRARTRAAEEATSSLPGCLLLPWSLPRRHAAPTPSHFSLALWTSLPLAPLFPLPRPNGAAATDESHRGYRPPHGSPTPQEAPPVLPLPPHQDGRRRKPWMGPASPFPSSATADRRRQIRPRPASLKLAVHLYRVYVSSPSVSPSLFRRSRAIARLSTAAESFSPPAMAWPWPQPPQLAPEPTVVLTATPGGRSALPFPLLCTVAPFPPTPEVRQPLSSTPVLPLGLFSVSLPVRAQPAS